MSSHSRTRPPVVHVVDDDPAVLRGIVRILASEGFETLAFDSPSRFLAAHDPDVPGCLVLDLAMPEMDGLTVQARLAESTTVPSRPIVFLTGRGDVPRSVAAMKGGAIDFLGKPIDADALLDAVRRALDVDARSRERLANDSKIVERLATLTPREREVMSHVVAGRLNKEVAAILGTTEKTVKVHRGRVMEKMGAESLAALVRMGVRLGDRVEGRPGTS